MCDGQQFQHDALFYGDRDEFLAATSVFVRAGAEAAEPTLVVLSKDKIAALRAELGDAAEHVQFADMAEVGSNPARIIPAWTRFVDEQAPSGKPLRGIGEPIWNERSAAELVECQHHESLLNVAFADSPPFRLLCPYDTGSLPDAVLEEARRSHRHLIAGGRREDSPDFLPLEDLARPLAKPLPDPEGHIEWRVFQAGTLTALHDLVFNRGRAAGLEPEEADDLVLAVHEAATNSVRHGGGGGLLRVWESDDAVVCEVDDRGAFDSPLAGRELPRAGQEGGWGLWLANQLCDLVQIRTFPNGSAVRLHKRLP